MPRSPAARPLRATASASGALDSRPSFASVRPDHPQLSGRRSSRSRSDAFCAADRLPGLARPADSAAADAAGSSTADSSAESRACGAGQPGGGGRGPPGRSVALLPMEPTAGDAAAAAELAAAAPLPTPPLLPSGVRVPGSLSAASASAASSDWALRATMRARRRSFPAGDLLLAAARCHARTWRTRPSSGASGSSAASGPANAPALPPSGASPSPPPASPHPSVARRCSSSRASTRSAWSLRSVS
eukprot:360082-Chlamydomonas_euryale.AAC.1